MCVCVCVCVASVDDDDIGSTHAAQAFGGVASSVSVQGPSSRLMMLVQLHELMAISTSTESQQEESDNQFTAEWLTDRPRHDRVRPRYNARLTKDHMNSFQSTNNPGHPSLKPALRACRRGPAADSATVPNANRQHACATLSSWAYPLRLLPRGVILCRTKMAAMQ